ncbi:MAG: response regulator transcription factor [Vicinamibacteria bacterium]|nr:response regulator transcription factor [Vicinamibacteria bacterium]
MPRNDGRVGSFRAPAGTASEAVPAAEPSPADTRAADDRPRVLLIEDDRDIAEAITYQLEKSGMSVRMARNGEEGLDLARRGVDLVLLDLNLPGMDGLEVCRMIRRQTSIAKTPILIISARAEEVDRVLGLEIGADDYLVKPFSLKELVARCRAALRRSEMSEEPRQHYRDENWEIDLDAFSVRYQGQSLAITRKEFEILNCLLARPGQIVTRERLLEKVWGNAAEIDARTIDAHIRRLRQKLGPGRKHIETVVGFGYRFSRAGAR